MRHVAFALLFLAASAIALAAQEARSPSAPVEFDVVSIKRHDTNDFAGGMRTMPDGTFVMTNATVAGIVLFASPVEARDLEGLPTWATSERYDLTAKPP